MYSTYVRDVLALEFSEELLQAVIVSIDANGAEKVLDVLCGWFGVAAEAEEKVSREMLHFEVCVCSKSGLGDLRFCFRRN
jgi:hypothetical protein